MTGLLAGAVRKFIVILNMGALFDHYLIVGAGVYFGVSITKPPERDEKTLNKSCPLSNHPLSAILLDRAKQTEVRHADIKQIYHCCSYSDMY